MQDHGDGLRPLAFMSKAFKPSEQRYSAYERELAAVAFCLIQWRHYLEGCPGGVTVITDHKPLTTLMQQQVLSRSQTRWLRLGLFQSIQPVIKYQPGKANVLADALSRSRGTQATEMLVNQDEDTVHVMTRSSIVPVEEVSAWHAAQREDPVLREIIQQVEQQSKEIRGDYELTPQGLLYQVKAGQRKLMVPVSLRQGVLKSCHDDPTAGHIGIHRTLEIVQRTYSWRKMGEDVKAYVRSCPVCQMMKSDHRKKAGLLQPIPIPTRRWQHVTTDLVTDLPESNGHTAVAVFVDRLSKMVHFAPCRKEVSAQEYARLFVDHIFRLHGMPEVIISDRDPRFTGKFWTELFQLLGTDLRFSTAYHPQTDGQSEVTIRVLENFLRPYVERFPETWAARLGLAEFAANNAENASTGFTPFFLNSGEDPMVPTTLMSGTSSATTQTVTETLDRMKEALVDAQTNLTAAQQRMKQQADKSRRSEEFVVGDEVVLTTKHLRNFAPHLPMKLKRRWVGPFPITRVVSPVAYELDLPPGWHIHSSFHVSKLKRYIRSDEFLREVEPPPPELIEGELEYEVESIARHRGKGARTRYLVIWKGYPLSEATWEPESSLLRAPDVLADYLRRTSTSESSSRTRRTT